MTFPGQPGSIGLKVGRQPVFFQQGVQAGAGQAGNPAGFIDIAIDGRHQLTKILLFRR